MILTEVVCPWRIEFGGGKFDKLYTLKVRGYLLFILYLLTSIKTYKGSHLIVKDLMILVIARQTFN